MTNDGRFEDWVERLSALRQHQHGGKRVPHKPLLVLMALGRLAETGSSELSWSEVEERLADLIAEFGPATRTGRRQSAAYPFTRLRTDGVWKLSRDVPRDNVPPWTKHRSLAAWNRHSKSSYPGPVRSSKRPDCWLTRSSLGRSHRTCSLPWAWTRTRCSPLVHPRRQSQRDADDHRGGLSRS
jgi:hypothetical protein